MKTSITIKTVLTGLLALAGHVEAQTNYSFPISTILAAGPAGVRLPNGTIVRADKVTTGTATHATASGTSNPTGMGGTFTGTSFLPAYVGSTVVTTFTEIGTDHTNSLDNGMSNNCARGIGFRIYFDRPTIKISFLALDIDGLNTDPGNAEWVGSFAFNGTTYVPYTQIIDGTMDPEATAPLTINTTAPHNWRTLITNTAGAAAAASLPNSMQIQRGAGSGISPDDLRGQVIFTPTDPNAPVTDFYLLWGLWRQPSGDNAQASGLSPIVVRVSPDFGDDPDSYKTLLASGGPSHGVVGTLLLGTNENTKPDGQPSAAANLDTDDDGVATVPLIPNNGSLSQVIPIYSLTTSFINNVGIAANYVAWIDWNNNGTFDPTEAQTATTAAGVTTGTVTFTWTNVTLSGTNGLNHTYARIRTTTEAITTANVGGAFKDGEVEDYLIPFSTVLPLQLVSFSGTASNNQVLLNWKTENEINVHYFIIERSADGRQFSPLGQVNANGGSAGGSSYQFADATPLVRGINYYRIHEVDMDGRNSLSPVIRLNTSTGNSFMASVVPNPADQVINLLLEGVRDKETLLFEITNASGMLIYQQQLVVDGTTMAKAMPRPALSAGIYFYKVIRRMSGETTTGRIVLQ